MTGVAVVARAPRMSLAIGIVVLTLCMLGGMSMGWVGYIGSDDWAYILNARDRMVMPWVIGIDHWEVRLTMTWPMAAAFVAFGQSEYSAALPTLAYAWATGVVVLVFLWRRVGPPAALLAGLFLALSPLLVVNATSLRIDAVENFFVLTALLSFLIAVERAGTRWLLLACGILTALAFVTRPTAVALLAFYGMVIPVGIGFGRARFLWLAIGFLVVWLAESFYYLHGTGRWFYRLGIDFGHDRVVRAGTLFDAVLLAPMRMLLTSHSFGLAFWLLPVMAWYAGREKVAGQAQAQLVRVLAAFTGVWILVFAGFASKLVLDPRYLTPALTTALIVLAIALTILWRRGRHVLAVGITSLLLAVQVLGLYVENKDFLYAERWLVQLAQQNAELVYTDPQTRERALFLLQVAGVDDHVRAAPPPLGALYLSVPANAARGRYNKQRWQPDDYRPGAWPVQQTFDPGRTNFGDGLLALGLDQTLPPALWTKIAQPNPAVVLYRRTL